jgi:hypothetical protein
MKINWKPLVNDLLHFKTMLYWLIPVAKNIRKVYDANSNDENELGDVSTHFTLNSIGEIDNLLKAYKSNDLPDAENKYVTLYSDLNPYFTPFQDTDAEFNRDIITDSYVLDNFNVVIDNLGNLYSSVVEKNIIKSKRFVVEKYFFKVCTYVTRTSCSFLSHHPSRNKYLHEGKLK